MSCSVTIQSVTATAQGTGSILHVTVVADGCKALQLAAECAGGIVNQIYTLNGPFPQTGTYDLASPCPCGQYVSMSAMCIDPITHLAVPGCSGDMYQGPILCGNICCVQPQIRYVPGACNANNERTVTFTITFNVPATLPPTCFPLMGYLDFGDTNNGIPHTIPLGTTGAITFTDTHAYNATGPATYLANWISVLPAGCPPVPITVNVSPCTPVNCCTDSNVTTIVGPCNASGQRDVHFNVWMNVSNTACTYVFYIDFGDNQYSLPINLTPSDPQPVIITHTYDAQTQTSATATLHFTLPSNCPVVSIPVNLGPPCAVDCCPKVTNVTIDPGPCQSDCTRSVTIKTYFSAPPSPPCQTETLQWHFFDKNNNPITNVSSIAFLTSGASPNVQSFIFDPALSPITATLAGLQYPRCVDTVRIIDVKPCDGPPACPTIHSFSAKVLGCENVGGKCLRRVEFTVDGDIAAGCGASAGTKIEIDFDDNDQAQLQYYTSGHVTTTISHHYAGGVYQATLTILNPSQCLGQSIPVHVPPCAPEDCKMDAPCPPLPEPPPGCFCKLCYIFSKKAGKGWCKAILVFVALFISLVIVGVFLGAVNFNFNNIWTWPNLFALLSAIGLVPAVVWYPKACSDCCAACALLLGLILAIIAVIILAIFQVPLVWLKGIILLIVLFVTWLIFNAWCKKYADQHLTADTWCKDD